MAWNWWIAFSVIVLFLFLGWRFNIMLGYELVKIEKSLIFNTQSFFDRIFKNMLISSLIARLAYILESLNKYLQYGFSIFPYIKVPSAGQSVWFSTLPWRFLRFSEGIDLAVFVIVWSFLVFGYVYKYYKYINNLNIDDKLKHRLHKYLAFSAFFIFVLGYIIAGAIIKVI